MSLDARRVINGTYGECWLDDELVSECFGLQAKIDIQKEDVPICGKASKSKKIVGWEGKGTVKLNKVNSRMVQKIGKMLKNGREVRVKIISTLADPDSFGAERVEIRDILFDDLTLADWEHAKNGQIEAPFTFEDFNMIDEIEPQD